MPPVIDESKCNCFGMMWHTDQCASRWCDEPKKRRPKSRGAGK